MKRILLVFCVLALLVSAPVQAAIVVDGGEAEAVSPQVAAPQAVEKAASQEKAQETPAEKRFNFDFRGADVYTILKAIEKESKANIIAESGLVGTLNLSLKKVTLEEALDLVCRLLGLEWRALPQTYVVASKESIKQYDRPVIESYRVNFAKTDEVKSVLTAMLQGIQVVGDVRTRTITVSGTQEQHAKLKGILEKLDQKIPQVFLRVTVLDITEGDSKNQRMSIEKPVSTNSEPSINLGIVEGVIDLLMNKVSFLGSSWDIQAKLDLAVGEDRARVLASPTLATLDGQKASILIGDRYPLVKTDTNGNTSAEYIPIGINLDFTPQISETGEVTLDVKSEISSVGNVVQGKYPQVSTRTVTTQIRAKDREPIVIGGLFGKEERQSLTKLPGLGDLPFFNLLFKGSTKSNKTSEVIMVVTPYILNSSATPVPMSEAVSKVIERAE